MDYIRTVNFDWLDDYLNAVHVPYWIWIKPTDWLSAQMFCVINRVDNKVFDHHKNIWVLTLQALVLYMLETSALEFLYSGQIT